ncbi:MAG: hypothetical protein ACRD4O_17145, partial [Bryobacteraceae bacterium]
ARTWRAARANRAAIARDTASSTGLIRVGGTIDRLTRRRSENASPPGSSVSFRIYRGSFGRQILAGRRSGEAGWREWLLEKNLRIEWDLQAGMAN